MRKAGSAGVPVFFADVRVVRPDLTPASAGEPGEVLIQGPNVTPGYWRDPEATAAAMTEGGWFRSGDIGVMDDEGHLTIVDRVKDMFISGGENVYPAEVESALFTHPAVAEAAVVGVPDAKWGEGGRAFVVPRPGAAVSAGGPDGLPPPPPGEVQDPGLLRRRRRPAEDGLGKGPQVAAPFPARVVTGRRYFFCFTRVTAPPFFLVSASSRLR